MPSLTKHDIIGFLCYNDDGNLCIVNESGSYVVLIESEEPMILAPARRLTLTESQDVKWKNTVEVETWDAEILADLEFDLQEEGRVPTDEFSYENSKYSTIIISPV